MQERFKIHSTEALILIEYARTRAAELHIVIYGDHTYLQIDNCFEIHQTCFLNELARIRACQSNSSELLSQPSSDYTSITTSSNKSCQPGFETQVLY